MKKKNNLRNVKKCIISLYKTNENQLINFEQSIKFIYGLRKSFMIGFSRSIKQHWSENIAQSDV